MAADPADGGFRGDGVVIAASGVLFAAGIALLATGVWVEMPGPLAAYSDPLASWPVLVQVVLGAIAFLVWCWINRRRDRAVTVVLLALGIACVLVLGTASYARCPPVDQSALWGVVSRVLGLLLNNYTTEDFGQPGCPLAAAPLALQVARLAQLVVLLVAATSAVVLLLRGQFDRVVARFSPRLYVAIGVDPSGAVLLPALTAGAGRWTRVVVTRDPAAAWLSPARVAGWRIVAGDPEDPAVLRPLVSRPGGRNVLGGLAVLSPDAVEARRLFQAVDDATRGLRISAPVRALLRMDDAWQAEDWRRRHLGQPGRWVVDTISDNEVTARLLLLDVGTRRVRTLLVTGHSGLTFALLAEAAQQARESAVVGDREPLSLVLVDEHAQRVWSEHLLAQRGFGSDTSIIVEVDASGDVEARLAELGEAAPLGVIFSGDVREDEQRLASRLGVLHPSVVIYSRRDEVRGLGDTPLLAHVHAFGTTLDAGEGRPIDRWERLARLQHEAYVRANPDPGNPGRLPWDGGLSAFHRDSNVRQIVTTLGSAVEVGRSWTASAGSTGAGSPSDEQLERMAELEHESWRRHQAEHGRAHQDQMPWSRLAESSRAKTREGVRASLELLATLGYRSYDDPDAQWRRFRRLGEVVAVQRDEEWEWTTSTGEAMRARPGDWQVEDARGRRSVSAKSFAGTHEHLTGDRYRRTGTVEARRAVAGEPVVSPEGSAVAGLGQWVLRNPQSQEEWLVPDAHFRAAYEPQRSADPPAQ